MTGIDRKTRRYLERQNKSGWKKKETKKKGFFSPKENNFGMGLNFAVVVFFYHLFRYKEFTFWYPLIAFGVGYFLYWFFKRRGKDGTG